MYHYYTRIMWYLKYLISIKVLCIIIGYRTKEKHIKSYVEYFLKIRHSIFFFLKFSFITIQSKKKLNCLTFCWNT